MSAALNLPFWHCSSPNNVPDCSEELDIIIQRLAAADNDLDGVSEGQSQIPLDNGMPASELSSICDSESADPTNYEDIYQLNNNVSDSSEYKCAEKNGKCQIGYACLEKNDTNNLKLPDNSDIEWGEICDVPDRILEGLNDNTNDNLDENFVNKTMMCQTERVSVKNKVCGISNEYSSGMVGGDDKGELQRSSRQQLELKSSSDEINTLDVTSPRDSDLNPSNNAYNPDDIKTTRYRRDSNERKLRKGLSSCSTASSTCSAGSYSRRKHHKHKNKQSSKSPSPDDPTAISPKVTPIFLWVHQEDTRILDVMCEDYDHRNRIRLTKTSQGWRAIPKTEVFAAAIIPKAPSDVTSDSSMTKREERRNRKRRKGTSRRRKTKKLHNRSSKSGEGTAVPVGHRILDNQSLIKECSVSLSRDNVELYQKKNLLEDCSVESCASENEDEYTPDSPSGDVNTDFRESRPNSRQADDSSRASSRDTSACPEASERLRKMTKSSSCDFSLLTKETRNVVRSSSLDLSKLLVDPNLLDDDNIKVVQSGNCRTTELNQVDSLENVTLTDSVLPKVKKESNSDDRDCQKTNLSSLGIEVFQDNSLDEDDTEEFSSQRNHSDSDIVDMTKKDSEFNDADCDELGQLLKDIPDLEFVEEEELEEVEEDQWSTPTDLTLPKTKFEEEEEESRRQKVKLPILPPNISSLVTVTSSTRPPEPLTAPLPEVTITPIRNPNPKPAHQQKPQNKFLESLLSSPCSIKPERDEVTITRTSSKRSLQLSQNLLREKRDYSEDHYLESDSKNKRLKVEDITLKTLLSKQQSGKSMRSIELENCVKRVKNKHESENLDCSKSRLQELLTEGVSNVDPIAQLKLVLSNPDLAVPDPLLVPRARLPALVASPASEIPRLLTMHLDKKIEEAPCPPPTDTDMLEVSLSNLRSLLSYNPDKTKSSDTEDLAAYQKSLEAFLEWQRYQTELMEAQMKNSAPLTPGLSPGDMDVATANALNQMIWLPYLNQIDLNCGNNRDIMSLMNSMFSHGYPSNGTNLTAPPHISTNHFPQSSPFLTPTSPMDIESQMKTLAMWQEAVMSQQNKNSSKHSNNTFSTNHADIRPNIKIPNVPSSVFKKQSPRLSPSPQKRLPSYSQFSTRPDIMQNQKPLNYENYQLQLQHQTMLRQQALYEQQRKQQKRQQELQAQHQRQLEHHRQIEMQQRQRQEQQLMQLQLQNLPNFYQELSPKQIKDDCEKKISRQIPAGSITVKPLSNLIDKSLNREMRKPGPWQKLEELRKNSDLTSTSQIALKWQQFEEEMKKMEVSKSQSEIKAENIWLGEDHYKSAEELTEEENYLEKTTPASSTPKLKVKNLVDPNMSPPKLLKQIDPEHLPVVDESGTLPDDSLGHLWHPLFGRPEEDYNPFRGYGPFQRCMEHELPYTTYQWQRMQQCNQIKGQTYNSPWRWTTVTVNGE